MKIALKDVLQQIRLFFILYIVLLGVCLVIKLTFSRETIYFAVNSRNFSWADQIAPFITNIGNGWTIVILSAILVLFNYRTAFLMASSYAITSITVQIVKHIFNKPRPTLYFQNQLNKIHFVKGVDMLRYDSFPSGHTVTAFSAAVLIAYLLKNKSWSILLLIIAILVGYSRMYLSEHFFEDVTAGSALGVFLTIFWLWYIEGKAFLHTDKWNKGLLVK